MCFLQVNVGAKTQCLSKEIVVGVVIPCWRRSQLVGRAKTGEPEKHLIHPQAELTWLVSYVASAGLEPTPDTAVR